MGKEEKKSIIIVAHKFLTQPDDDLVLFLNKQKYANVLHIYHSFSDAPDRSSSFVWYKDGVLYEERKTSDYKYLPEPLIYGKEFLFTVWWVWRSGIIWERYIGMDGLLVLFGNILRFFRRVRQTVFWAIDFVPEDRFASGIRNKIYRFINVHSYKNADAMWDLSPRMAAAREKFLGITKNHYRSHRVVPYGLWLDRIKHYSYEECEKDTLVFMGHLLEKQGVQLVIQAIPEIIKNYPNFHFKIIGDGYYREKLLGLAQDIGVLRHCDFRGKIENIMEVEEEIARSAVAIAPYVKSLDTWTYYADPGKVKTYLACGVPLLLTNIPWNAHEIEETKCGMIITEDVRDIVSKTLSLMENTRNAEYRKNAVQYSQGFNYENIFRGLL